MQNESKPKSSEAQRKSASIARRARSEKHASIEFIKTRFWNLVDIKSPSECWPWKSAKRRNYGVFVIAHKKYGAHRLAYVFSHGPITDCRLRVCHYCDFGACCNPTHLFLGTDKDNVADCIAKNRRNAPACEAHYRTKLTNELVLEMRVIFAKGVKTCEIARRFKIPYKTVWGIVHYKVWKHVK